MPAACATRSAHEQTGLLVAPEDHVRIAEAISDLLLDRERVTHLGEGGRQWAERFAGPAVVRQVEDVLLSVAGSRR